MATVDQAQAGGYLTQKQVIDMLYARSLRVLRGLENEKLSKVMDAYRRAQDEIVGQILTRYGDTEGWSLLQWQQSGRLRALLQSVDDVLTRMKDQVEGDIHTSATTQFFTSYDMTAYTMDQATPATTAINYAIPPENAVRILTAIPYKGAMFSQRIGMITDGMASDIRDELTQSLIQGEGLDAAASRVRDVIGVNSLEDPRSYTYRAKVIAQTEIMRAQGMARDLVYEQNKDVVDDENWLVTPDDKLCPWCMRREGMTDAEIEAAPAEADGKEDPFGNSSERPLHPWCRCDKIPVLKSWQDLTGLDMPENTASDVRGIRNEDGDWEIAPVESFDDWLSQRTGVYA